MSSPCLFLLSPQLFHLIYSSDDYVKQLAKQPGWQDVLTKLYVKESYESHPASIAGSSTNSSLEPSYRPPLCRDQALVLEEPRTELFLSYRTSQDNEDEEEDEGGQRDTSEGFSDSSQSPLSGGGGPLKTFTGSIHFKSFDSVDQGSHSSTVSTPVDFTSSRPDEEGRDYQPLSPFGSSPLDLDLGVMGEMGAHTPAGSLTNTPSPLEQCKPFPPLRPRKSSSLSNVLDDTSYGTDPPTGDTISNTSNPQVLLLPYLCGFLDLCVVIRVCERLGLSIRYVTADPRGGTLQPSHQHHLLRAVERQRSRGA